MLCPACGHAIAPVELTVHDNAIAARGHVVKVSPAIAVLIARLSKDAPRPVSLSSLINEVWGLRDEPETSDNAISVRMCLARKLLRPLGYDIESIRASYRVHERAYRLVPVVRSLTTV